MRLRHSCTSDCGDAAFGWAFVKVGLPGDDVDRDVPPLVADRERLTAVVGSNPGCFHGGQHPETKLGEQRFHPSLGRLAQHIPRWVTGGCGWQVGTQFLPQALEIVPVAFRLVTH